jgi:anti-anti-sigma regulatory factor
VLPIPQSDRCPYSRPFPPGFNTCRAYQPVSFTAANSLNQPLGVWLTCRHLTSGKNGSDPGGYYPRCGLGADTDRVTWVAQVRPERLEVIRALHEELDIFSRPFRRRLLEAKAEYLAMPRAGANRDRLDSEVATYLVAVREFLATHEARMADAGLPVEPMGELIEDWIEAWVTSRELGPRAAPDEGKLKLFPRPVQAFLGAATTERWRHEAPAAAAGQAIDEDGALSIRAASDGGVRVAGDLDAGTVPAFTEALERAALSGGDVRVDMSALLFADLGALRALVKVAQSLPPGARVEVAGMPSHLVKVMAIVRWDEMPNLVVRAAVAEPAA